MTTNKTTPEQLIVSIFNKLHTFFDGQFQLGIHGITYSKKFDKMVDWAHPVGWFFEGQDLTRNAVLTDMAFCLKKNRENLDVYIRPSAEVEDRYILFDDISAEKSVRWSKRPGTMIICTSPGKFQAWRKLDRPMSNEEKMAYIVMEGADESATPKSRWYRCPGFKNCKAKYSPNFPMVRVNVITEGISSLNKLETVKPTIVRKEYVDIKAKNIKATRADYIKFNDKGGIDESRTDYTYTLVLLGLGASDGDITSRIFNERTNWDNKSQHDSVREDYVRRTIANAKKFKGI
jgi:RepB DNA-primase from phage plasmid